MRAIVIILFFLIAAWLGGTELLRWYRLEKKHRVLDEDRWIDGTVAWIRSMKKIDPATLTYPHLPPEELPQTDLDRALDVQDRLIEIQAKADSL